MKPETIPHVVASAVRQVVKKDPLRRPCEVLRMTVNRTEPLSGGTPTIGGMGVLTPDDEENVTWNRVGDAYILPAEPFQPSLMMDRRDAHNGAGDEFRFFIEPYDEPYTDGWFEIKNQDIVIMLVEGIVKVAYEVVALENMINIPPFVWRYILQRRDDFHRDLP